MTFENPQLLLLLAVLPVLVVVWAWRGMRVVPNALLLRLLVVALVIMALAKPTQPTALSYQGPLIILVDQSDSLTAEGQQLLRLEANRLARSLEASSSQTALLWFGEHTVALGEWGAADPLTAPPPAMQEALQPADSDLGGALRTARELLAAATSQDTPASTDSPTGRVMLLSDGLQTSGDVLAEARLTAEAGITVDVLGLETPARPELRIVDVDAPQTLRAGEEYTVQIAVLNTAAAEQTSEGAAGLLGTLRLWANDQLLGEEQVTLEPGLNVFSFPSRANDAGVIRLAAEIEGSPDTFVANNRTGTTATVTPPPLVLLVEGRDEIGNELSAALWNAGIESESIPPAQIPTRLSELGRYDGLVLLDVSANDLSLDQMTSVREFVRSEGRGLVAAGGFNSYGLGAYADTPLEEALPVDMDAPPRPERSEVALLLIIDRSASMDTALGVSKFDMAKEAAILSTETLRSEDTIGVLAFDTGQQWTVPFQRLGEGIGLKQIQDNIATLPTGGGTDIYSALSIGLGELSRQTTDVRHVVLLTDGRSFTDDRTAYRALAEAALAQNITISTIAIGLDSDTELLDQIAQWGGGRYYYANDAEDIPRLTLQESEIARSDPSVEGGFQAQLAAAHPILREFAPAELPALEGYIATTAKEEGEVILVSPDNDPILVSWQYGLGRAVAWTPSTGAPWASQWPAWGNYGRYWAQVVGYTLPENESGPLQVSLEPQPGGVALTAHIRRDNGEPLDLATAQARVVLPDGSERIFTLLQKAPGSYSQDVRLPTPGPYSIEVIVERDAVQYRAVTGYTQPIPAEYLPPQEGSGPQGVDLLRQVAATTGGAVIDADSVVAAATQAEEAATEQNRLFQQPAMWLLLAALLLWLLEIAVRRGLFIRD